MYVMRFLDGDGKTALSVLLHSPDFEGEDYEGSSSGNPQAWKALVDEYGEKVTVQI